MNLSIFQFPLMQRALAFENDHFSLQFCVFPSKFVLVGLGM